MDDFDFVSRKLKILRETTYDKKVLDEFINNLSKNYDLIQGKIEDPEDRALLAKNIEDAFKIIHKWNSDPVVYPVLKPKIDVVRDFKSHFDSAVTEQRRKAQPKSNHRNDYSPDSKYPSSEQKRYFEHPENKLHGNSRPLMPDQSLKSALDSIIQGIQKSDSITNKCIPKNIEEIPLINESAPNKMNLPAAADINPFGIKNTCSMDLLNSNFSPTLKQLSDFYSDNGLVGNVGTSILMTLGAINGLCFGIKSLSGSGKTVSLDILVTLLGEENAYILKQSSDKALMYDADKVNRAKVVVLTELQKSATKTMVDILKDLGEGKSANRKVTKTSKNGVMNQEISSGKSVIYTLAIENWFKEDKELERRYFTLSTDISKEHIGNVLDRLAQKSYLGERIKTLSEDQHKMMIGHVQQCLEISPSEYVNPFAPRLVETMPRTVKTTSFAKHYLSLVNSCTKFHYRNRLRYSPATARTGSDPKDSVLFTSLQDIYCIETLYREKFEYSVKEVPFFEECILKSFKQQPLSVNDVYDLLHEQFSASLPMVQAKLEHLVELKYLTKKIESSAIEPNLSVPATEKPVIVYEKKESPAVDWVEMFNSAYALMKKNYPGLAENWKYSQMTGNKIIAKDVFTGSDIVLVDFD